MPLNRPVMSVPRRTRIIERLQAAIRAEADGVTLSAYDLGHLVSAYRRSAEIRNCLAAFDPANLTNPNAGPDDPLPGEPGFGPTGPQFAETTIPADESGEGGTGETDDEGRPLPRTPVPRTPAEADRERAEAKRAAEADAPKGAQRGAELDKADADKAADLAARRADPLAGPPKPGDGAHANPEAAEGKSDGRIVAPATAKPVPTIPGPKDRNRR